MKRKIAIIGGVDIDAHLTEKLIAELDAKEVDAMLIKPEKVEIMTIRKKPEMSPMVVREYLPDYIQPSVVPQSKYTGQKVLSARGLRRLKNRKNKKR